MQLNIKRVALRVRASRVAFVAALTLLPGASLAGGGDASLGTAEAVELGVTRTAEVSSEASAAGSVFEAASWSDVPVGAVSPKVFAMALHAASVAVQRGQAKTSTLTVIDFSRPSTERRLWVYDLRSRALLFEEFVSHGRNSGMNLATSFSNVAESNMSSLGVYRTAEAYFGKHGYSLRLDGLDRGFNDRARERAIVIHGAEYVSEQITRAQGRLGRSLGCPAVRPEVSRELIDAVKGGGLVFAYYPDPNGLRTSAFLN